VQYRSSYKLHSSYHILHNFHFLYRTLYISAHCEEMHLVCRIVIFFFIRDGEGEWGSIFQCFVSDWDVYIGK
jgi:hypothetical protein